MEDIKKMIKPKFLPIQEIDSLIDKIHQFHKKDRITIVESMVHHLSEYFKNENKPEIGAVLFLLLHKYSFGIIEITNLPKDIMDNESKKDLINKFIEDIGGEEEIERFIIDCFVELILNKKEK